MAKNTAAEASTETAVEGTATEAKAADSRLIVLNVPEGDPSGLVGSHPRNAVIRALAATGEWTRGAIAKHVSGLQFPGGTGKEVPYQIVFQATKGVENIKLVERNTAEAAPVAAEGETAVAE